MTSLPLVTIAMPIHNAETTVSLAIRSILLQTYPHWQLTLIDDGSTDSSLQVARSFHDQRISVISDGHQHGLPRRLNEIIERSEATYIARLDADDVMYPERLEKQVSFLEWNRKVDLLGTGAMVFENSGRAVGRYPVRVTHEEICRNPWAGFYLAHPTWMGRAEWFKKNRYRPEMRKAQDQDLLLRSYRTSTFACLPEILTGYRQHSLELKKVLAGRYFFCQALVLQGWREKNASQTALALIGQLIKAMFDALAISSGFGRRFLRHRSQPMNKEECGRWERCWETCNSGQRECAE